MLLNLYLCILNVPHMLPYPRNKPIAHPLYLFYALVYINISSHKGMLNMDTYQKYGSLDNAITTCCNYTGT
jgi:hypothetical protein